MGAFIRIAAGILAMVGLSSCASEITVEDGVFEFEATVTKVDTVHYLVVDMRRGRTSDRYTMTYLFDDDRTLQMSSAGAAAASPYSFSVGGNRSLRLRLPDLAVGQHVLDLQFTCSKTNQVQYQSVMFAIEGIPVTDIRPETESVTLVVGGETLVNIDVAPSGAHDKTLIVASADGSVAECYITESTRGLPRQMLKITGKKKGSSLITIYSADGKVSAGVGVTVN